MGQIGETGTSTNVSRDRTRVWLTTGAGTYTPPANEELFEVFVYQAATSNNGIPIEIGIYDISGGVNGASLVGSFVYTGNALTGQFVQHTLITPIPMAAGVEHAIAMIADSSTSFNTSQRSGRSSSRDDVVAGTGLSDPFVEDSTNTNATSLYGNTQAAASGPVLTLPTDVATSATTADGTVTTDTGDGTLYGVVTQSATPPSVAQIQAGQDDGGAPADWAGNQAVIGTGVQNMSATGLVASTAYFFHFQQENAATDDSTVVTADGFTTDAAPAGPPVDPPYTTSAVYDGSVIPPNSILHYEVGAQDGGDNQAVFTDSSLAMTINEFVGLIVENRTKGESATITANTATTITGVLSGAADWDNGDEMHVVADIDAPDVIYCEDQVTVTSELAPINWYLFDDSAGVYTELYTETVIDAAGAPNGVYSTAVAPDGVVTLTLIPPVLGATLSQPTAAASGETTADGTVNTDTDSGTLFYLVSQNATEDAATIKMGLSQSIIGVGTQFVSVVGLTLATQYYLHYIQNTSEGDSNIAKAPFTTDQEIPVLSLPTCALEANVTLSGTVQTDIGDGTMYNIATENASELAATIKAGNSQPVTAAGEVTVFAAGLLPNTAYFMHYIHTTSGGDSNIVSSTPAVMTEDLPPFEGSNTMDAILFATGGPTINDGLAIWYSKTMSETLNDAERRWLLAFPETSDGTNNDLWYQYLTGVGLTGSLNDMQNEYWIIQAQTSAAPTVFSV